MIITLTLNPSIDYIVQVPEIHMEDTLRAKYAFFQSGGKGINVSRVLKRLGIETEAWGFCGGDTGKWLESYLDEEKVPHAFVHTRAETRINPIITELESKKQLRISASGETVSHQECEALFDQFENLDADEVDFVAVGGSLPPGMTPDVMRELVTIANNKKIPVALDADGEVLKHGLLGQPYLVKPNQYELERLLGISIDDPKAIIEGGRQLLQKYGVSIVVTSMAEAGAMLITASEVIQATAPEVEVQSKVGAGDSMVAGLLKGLTEKQALPDVLRMGVAAGTSAVMTPGNELCQKHLFETLLSQVKIHQNV